MAIYRRVLDDAPGVADALSQLQTAAAAQQDSELTRTLFAVGLTAFRGKFIPVDALLRELLQEGASLYAQDDPGPSRAQLLLAVSVLHLFTGARGAEGEAKLKVALRAMLARHPVLCDLIEELPERAYHTTAHELLARRVVERVLSDCEPVCSAANPVAELLLIALYVLVGFPGGPAAMRDLLIGRPSTTRFSLLIWALLDLEEDGRTALAVLDPVLAPDRFSPLRLMKERMRGHYFILRSRVHTYVRQWERAEADADRAAQLIFGCPSGDVIKGDIDRAIQLDAAAFHYVCIRHWERVRRQAVTPTIQLQIGERIWACLDRLRSGAEQAEDAGLKELATNSMGRVAHSVASIAGEALAASGGDRARRGQLEQARGRWTARKKVAVRGAHADERHVSGVAAWLRQTRDQLATRRRGGQGAAAAPPPSMSAWAWAVAPAAGSPS